MRHSVFKTTGDVIGGGGQVGLGGSGPKQTPDPGESVLPDPGGSIYPGIKRYPSVP